MRPSFYPRLINHPFDDPGLFIPFLYEKRAILFDIGDISALTPRDILKISHVFITHTHMDHFCGFDHLLRLLLGRKKRVSFFGPTGFLKNIEGKLAGYTWNLVSRYDHSFSILATEVRHNQLLTREYRCQNAFEPTEPVTKMNFNGTLASGDSFTVSGVILDHSIDCLGFRIKEKFHINILKDRLSDMGLSVGPWIREFKQALFNHVAPDTTFVIRDKGAPHAERSFRLETLSNEICRITEGQMIVYIADASGDDANIQKIIEFAKAADHLFIEAAFLEKDRQMAAVKNHLTARQAGGIARKAGVKQYTLFHFSPRYTDMMDLLEQEAKLAFNAA